MSHADTVVAVKIDSLFGDLAAIRSRLYRGELDLDNLGDLETLMKSLATSRKYHFLEPIASAELSATEAFDPKELKQRPDVWLSDNMKQFILPAAGQIGPLPKGTLPRFDLKKLAYDKEIVGELPENHIFSASEFLARFAKLTALQPGGKPGTLLSNGYANIVYVYGVNGRFTACVYWAAVDGRWVFYVHWLGGYQWGVDYRVLVATTGPVAS